jgi:hypothetical protein
MTDSSPEKGFFRRQLTLTNAVLLSVILHLVAVIGSELSFPDFYTPPDEILARKQPEKVQRVRIAAAPKPKAVVSGPRFISSTPKPPPPEPVKPKPSSPDPAGAGPSPAEPSDDTLGNDAGTNADTALPGAETVIPPEEPAPAFPVQIRADLELRLNNLSAVAEQRWVMEGFRYFITVNGSKFGFKAQLESEGEIGADGGLRPTDFRMKINDRIRHQSEYRNGTLRYGKPSKPKSEAVTEPPQDMASLPFHVAVTFNGAPQVIKVTSGKSLYEVRLVLDAEETIKLPVGTLRTLHLRGERYNPADGTLIAGYEVWLAPDYLNYPVKFIGRTGKGDSVEYRVKRLEIEGKNVLGDPSEHVLTPEGDDIPEWLKHRVNDAADESETAAPPLPE